MVEAGLLRPSALDILRVVTAPEEIALVLDQLFKEREA